MKISNINPRYIAILILLLILAFFLANCSCDWHLSRAEKKCGSIKKDTLTLHDTLTLKEVRKDTIFKYFQKDTVIIREGRLTMKYFYNSHDSTVYLKGQCDTVKIVRELKVPYEKVVIKTDYFPKWLMWCLIGLTIAIIVFKFIK